MPKMGTHATSDSPTKKSTEQIMTNAVLIASEKLGLSEKQLAETIQVNEHLVSKFKSGDETLESGTDAYFLAILLIRVFRSLKIITGGEHRVGRSWMKSHNTDLDGLPINLVSNKSGLENVVKYLDARRSTV